MKQFLESKMGHQWHSLLFFENLYYANVLLEEIKHIISLEEVEIFKNFTLVIDEMLHCEICKFCSPKLNIITFNILKKYVWFCLH